MSAQLTQVDVALISALILLIGAGIAFFSFIRNKRLKTIDVIMKCDDRYDSLFAERNRLNKEGNAIARIASPSEKEEKLKELKSDTELFYIRYWSLQLDQLDYYHLGFVERVVFLNWVIHKARLFGENKQFGTLSFKDGWRQVGRQHFSDSDSFVDFVDAIERISDRPHRLREACGDLIDRSYRREWHRRVFR